MQHFVIDKTTNVKPTFRVKKLMADFDISPSHANEHFEGDFNFPKHWNIGLIVGGSGTGKTTIAKSIFKNDLITGFKYTHDSVIDDMPKNMSVEEISKTFYSVGFGSVPSWLKPYSVLSNGEKMRVDITRALAERQLTVFDEFTSVVDRQVAKVVSMAVAKAIRKHNKQFVAVSCHHDITDWLQPDWVFDTDTMKFYFTKGNVPDKRLQSKSVQEQNGDILGSITI